MPTTPSKPPPSPKRVRIGHRFFQVEYLERVVSGGQACDGLCTFQPPVISIDKKLDPHAMAETFVHECLHAMHEGSGLLYATAELEETFVTRDAKALCLFFQQNPKALNWLLALLAA